MNKELADKVRRIKKRVVEKEMKPLADDVYTLLEYVTELENIIGDVKQEANNLNKQGKDLLDMYRKMGNPMFGQMNNPLFGQMNNLSGLGVHGGPMGQVNPEVEKFIKRFVTENKGAILEESEKTRERIVDEFGEGSFELAIFESVMKRIEDMDYDEDDDEDDEGYSSKGGW